MFEQRLDRLDEPGDNPPIAKFLERNPNGGMHHLCYEVDDLIAVRDKLVAEGAKVLGSPRIGAHGKLVLFLHPKDFVGTLIELEQT
jgi:methylmalonyl-CoA/ethylmalonyl-CoA epimerase